MHTKNQDYMENADYTWSEDSIRYINTASLSARQTFFYVQEAGYFLTSPPYFTERKNLASYLIIYTISGRGQLTYQDSTYCLSPGTVMFIDCMNYHYYECLKNQKWEILWLHFNGTSAMGYYNEFIKNKFHILDSLDPFFIESKLRRILSLTQQKDYLAEILVSGLIVEILTQILVKNSSKNMSHGSIPDYLKKTIKEMDSRFRETLTLDQLAGFANISKFHFSREFKRYIGMTPNEYIIVTRISHAKEMLKYTDLTIEEITFDCGFHNVSHFINLFKVHEKITPLKYRAAWRNG